MPHGGVPNARSLTARDVNRAIINVSAMRVIFGQCPKDQVPFLQLCEAEPWSAPPPAMPVGASSGCSPSSAAARAAPPRYMAKPPVSRLEWDPVVKDFIDNLDGNPLEIDKREKKGVK